MLQETSLSSSDNAVCFWLEGMFMAHAEKIFYLLTYFLPNYHDKIVTAHACDGQNF